MVNSFIHGKNSPDLIQMECWSGFGGVNTIYDQLKWGQKQTVAILFLLVGVIDMNIDWSDRIVTELVSIYVLNKTTYTLHKKINLFSQGKL